MSTPDMTKEYQAELKKLQATLAKDERATNRALNKLEAAKRKRSKETGRAIRLVEKEMGKAIKLLRTDHDKALKAMGREIRNVEQARSKRTDAITRRIQILEGRLAS